MVGINEQLQRHLVGMQFRPTSVAKIGSDSKIQSSDGGGIFGTKHQIIIWKLYIVLKRAAQFKWKCEICSPSPRSRFIIIIAYLCRFYCMLLLCCYCGRFFICVFEEKPTEKEWSIMRKFSSCRMMDERRHHEIDGVLLDGHKHFLPKI